VNRLTIVVLCCLLNNAGAWGQGPPPADQNLTPTTNFVVTPAGESDPALRWRLLPEVREQHAGDAANGYLRAVSPEPMARFVRAKNPDLANEALEWPLADLRTARATDLRWVKAATALLEADRAARCDWCNWHLQARAREEGIALLLPDMQSMRSLSRLASLRTRFALAEGDFDAAIRSLQTQFALGRHCGADSCTLIQSLVAAAVCTVAVNNAAEFVQLPGAPNLYWALTAFPDPFIPFRKGMEGERTMMDAMFPGFRDALESRTAPPPLDLNKARASLTSIGAAANPLSAGLLIGTLASGARDYLTAHGWSKESLSALPITTIVILHEIAVYDQYFDDFLKLAGLQPSVALPRMDVAERRLMKDLRAPSNGSVLAKLMLPAATRAYFAQVRLDRRIAGLRCVEAIRMHAAVTGKLPKSAEEVVVVPLPTDPATDKPFQMSFDGDAVTILASPPKGYELGGQNGFRYVVRLAKR
jgi:hypothetical protein